MPSTRKKSQEKGDVELGPKGFKAKNASNKRILLLIGGLLLAIAVWKFSYKHSDTPDGGTSTELQIRKANPANP